MNNILVTGGAGFIGSHILGELENESRKNVYVADNYTNGNKSNIDSSVEDIYEIDLTERKKCLNVFETVDFDMVYHTAAMSNVRSDGIGIQQFQQNTEITQNIVWCATKTTEPDISFLSSSVVYGETDNIPTPENEPLSPTSYYGAGKVASESLLKTYDSQTRGSIRIFRLANVIGPRLRNAVIPDFISKIRQNENKLEILGDGSQTKSYIHIDDCVSAIVGISEETSKNHIINVGTDSATSVTEIADIVCDELNVSPEYHYTGGRKGWEGDVPDMLLDISKLQSLGYKPTYSSEDAIKKATGQLAHEI